MAKSYFLRKFILKLATTALVSTVSVKAVANEETAPKELETKSSVIDGKTQEGSIAFITDSFSQNTQKKFSNKDSIKIMGNHRINILSGNVDISAIDLNGQGEGNYVNIEVNGNTILGSVQDTTEKLTTTNIVLSDGKKLTLSGEKGTGTSKVEENNYSGIDKIELGEDSHVVVNSDIHILSDFDGNGILELKGYNEALGEIGKDTALKQFIVSGNDVVKVGSGTSKAKEFLIKEENGTLLVTKGGEGKLIGKISGKGNLTFNGNADIQDIVGDQDQLMQSLNFKGNDTTVKLQKNIHARNVNFGKQKVVFHGGITITGKSIKANNTSLNLSDKLVVSTAKLELSGDVKMISTLSDSGHGRMMVTGVDYGSLNSLIIEITHNMTTPNEEIALITNSGSSFVSGKNVKAQVISSDDMNWGVSVNEEGSLILAQSEDKTDETILFAENNSSDTSPILFDDLEEQTVLNEDQNNKIDIVKVDSNKPTGRNFKNDVTVIKAKAATQTLSHTGKEVSNKISQRLSGFNKQNIADEAIEVGIAAGDRELEHGAWVSSFLSQATQKEHKGEAGYNANSYGGAVGFDTKISEDTILGITFSALRTNVKHKDNKIGDKTQINSLLLSLYGMHHINDKWFVQSMATIGSNEVIDKQLQTTGAKGSYNVLTFGGEALAGYNHKMQSMIVTPIAGLRYNKVGGASYKEVSATGSNDVSIKASQRLELIAGLRVTGKESKFGKMLITPEIHGFVNHDLVDKGTKVTTRPVGDNMGFTRTDTIRDNRTFYNLGVAANAQSGRFEYGVGYDLNLANKYTAHQVALKVRFDM